MAFDILKFIFVFINNKKININLIKYLLINLFLNFGRLKESNTFILA